MYVWQVLDIIILAGAILGCPTGECIHLANFTQRDVISVSTDASKLALNLLDVFFTKDVLSTSLATRWEGCNLLNLEDIEGIRHVLIMSCASVL